MNDPEIWDNFSEFPPMTSAEEWKEAYERSTRDGNHVDRINEVTEEVRRRGKVRPVPPELQLDEVVGRGEIHVERMGNDSIWMSLAGHNFWLFADGHRLEMTCENLEGLRAVAGDRTSKNEAQR